jgi:hypothetical protein
MPARYFSVFRAGVRSADLRPLGNYLVAAIEIELRAESLPTDTFSELESVRLAKTASRSTLGFMNEMAFELRHLIADTGGLGRCDIDVLNQSSVARSATAANTSARSKSPAGSPHAPDRNHFGARAPRAACKHGSVAAHSCRT